MTQDAPHDAPLVDSHAHVYTTDMPLSATAWHKPPADATFDQYIATLDRHGVKHAVLAAASLFDDYNEYSLEGFQAVMRAVDNCRTWVKLSAGYRLDSPQVAQDCAQALLAHAGPERLLWGSDWPFAGFEDSMRYEDAIASFRQWVPDANLRRIISGETALRLYFT